MNFPEVPASKQWSALKYRGETIADVWFKPEGEPFGVTIRIPQKSFQLPGMGPRLTPENLLRAVGIRAEEVESWRSEGASDSGASGPPGELGHPLAPPQDATHLNLYVRLKPPARAVVPAASGEPEVPEATWQDLEARWNVILGLEARIETQRISMETLRGELDALSRRALTTDEKVHALSADLAQWNKARSRLPHALPKVREFVHRATWAAGTPERKKLEELFKSHIQPRVAFAHVEQVVGQLESLLKDRQVLSAHGTSVYQECRGISAEVQGALRTLQGNAATNAARKRGATAAKGKTSARGKSG